MLQATSLLRFRHIISEHNSLAKFPLLVMVSLICRGLKSASPIVQIERMCSKLLKYSS